MLSWRSQLALRIFLCSKLIAIASSECHYDFRLGQTKCVHHDGSVFVGGKQISEGGQPKAGSLPQKRATNRESANGPPPLSSEVMQKRLELVQKRAEMRVARADARADAAGSPWVASCFDASCKAPWRDSRGRRIEAHGGGLLQVNGTFFWYAFQTKFEVYFNQIRSLLRA